MRFVSIWRLSIDKGETREARAAYWAPFVVVGEGSAGQ